MTVRIGTAKTAITFSQFDLTKPSVCVVLSVDDTVRLEFDFTASRFGRGGLLRRTMMSLEVCLEHSRGKRGPSRLNDGVVQSDTQRAAWKLDL